MNPPCAAPASGDLLANKPVPVGRSCTATERLFMCLLHPSPWKTGCHGMQSRALIQINLGARAGSAAENGRSCFALTHFECALTEPLFPVRTRRRAEGGENHAFGRFRGGLSFKINAMGYQWHHDLVRAIVRLIAALGGRFFRKPGQFRNVATRYEQAARHYLAVARVASSARWTRICASACLPRAQFSVSSFLATM
jgi:hypothetical protein